MDEPSEGPSDGALMEQSCVSQSLRSAKVWGHLRLLKQIKEASRPHKTLHPFWFGHHRHLDFLPSTQLPTKTTPPRLPIRARCHDPRKTSRSQTKFREEQSKILLRNQKDQLSEIMCLAWLNGSSAGTRQLNGLQIFEGCKQ